MKSTLSLTSEVICTRQPYFRTLFVSRFFAFSKRVQSGAIQSLNESNILTIVEWICDIDPELTVERLPERLDGIEYPIQFLASFQLFRTCRRYRYVHERRCFPRCCVDPHTPEIPKEYCQFQ